MPSFVLDKCLGAIETIHPLSIPPGYVASAVNVDLSDTEFLRPRAGTIKLSMTSGPSAEVVYLFADNANGRLWAFVAATGTAYYWNGSSWSSTSLGADYSSSATPHCVAHNGKVFMAFDGSVNRLHVYDGSSVRRVGLTAPSAPTVADTGAGTYAATQRYYKVRMYIVSGSTTVASSELSASVSFTPSGAGTAARITKPTTVDSATHWQVYGSTDDLNYYEIGPKIPVGTTTADDTTTPSNYSTGTIAPEAGLFVPPPSAKFLATNGERIFMAGSYETSAGSGETTPATRRIWFTRPLGATDAGDDEAITHTADSRYYLDIDNDDGGILTGLASTLDGAVYAFTSTSVWRLVDTGATDKPIRSERVVSISGALSQYLITTGDTEHPSRIYFVSSAGPFYYSPEDGAVFVGADWCDTSSNALSSSNPNNAVAMGWDPMFRRALMSFIGETRCRSFTPSYSALMGGRMRGGWCRQTFAYGNSAGSYITQGSVKAMAVFNGVQYLAGQRWNGAASVGNVFYLSPSVYTDDGVAFAEGSAITTADMMGDPTRNLSTSDLYVWKARSVGATVTIEGRFGPSYQALASDTASDQVGYDPFLGALHREKVEGTAVADTAAIRLTVGVSTFQTQTPDRLEAVARVDVPYKVQEPG